MYINIATMYIDVYMRHSGIKTLNKYEKPREKATKQGINNLTNEELLAIILRSGGKDNSAIDLARNLLKKFFNFKNLLTVELEELLQIKDIGIAKATSIKASCEIALRILDKSENIQKITTPEDVYKLMYKDLYGKQQEYLYLLNLNNKSIPISKDLLTIGTNNQTLITSRDIYKKALAKNATSIILIHNHPSNDPTPSKEDLETTETVAEAGKKIGIPLLDHIIFSDTKYVSLKSLNIFNTYKFK